MCFRSTSVRSVLQRPRRSLITGFCRSAAWQFQIPSFPEQSPGAAYVLIATLVKAQYAGGAVRQTDAYAFANFARLACSGCQPKRRTCAAQIHAIVSKVNLQYPGQSSRPDSTIIPTLLCACDIHGFGIVKRLNGPQQHPCTNSNRLARYVQ